MLLSSVLSQNFVNFFIILVLCVLHQHVNLPILSFLVQLSLFNILTNRKIIFTCFFGNSKQYIWVHFLENKCDIFHVLFACWSPKLSFKQISNANLQGNHPDYNLNISDLLNNFAGSIGQMVKGQFQWVFLCMDTRQGAQSVRRIGLAVKLPLFPSKMFDLSKNSLNLGMVCQWIFKQFWSIPIKRPWNVWEMFWTSCTVILMVVSDIKGEIWM